MAATYLYGIIRDAGSTGFGAIGLPSGGQEVYSVGLEGVAGVVSDYRGPDWPGLPREELLRALVIHQRVIERVMQEHTILPAKFGTLLPNTAQLRRALRCGLHALSTALEKTEGLVQYEVAATWEVGPVLKEIAAEEEIAQLRARAASISPSESLGLRIAVGAMVKESLDRRRGEIGRALTALLEKEAIDQQPNALMGDEMVLNVAFLMPRLGEQVFLARVQEADARFDGKLTLRCVGPLPPYSFSAVEILRPDPAGVGGALQLLGLGHQISASTVRRGFREQATRLHPDVNPSSEAADAFARLREAERLLVAYCRGKADGDGDWEERPCRVTAGELKRTYLVTVQRAKMMA